jgi:hypothetical protein
MKQATALKAGVETVTLIPLEPFLCRRFQIKCTHHRAFGPAVGDLVRDRIVEAAGKSHSDHTLGKWIHFRRAAGRKLGMHLEC